MFRIDSRVKCQLSKSVEADASNTQSQIGMDCDFCFIHDLGIACTISIYNLDYLSDFQSLFCSYFTHQCYIKVLV